MIVFGVCVCVCFLLWPVPNSRALWEVSVPLCEITCVEVGCAVPVFILYPAVGGNLVLSVVRNCFGKGEGGTFVGEAEVSTAAIPTPLLSGSVGNGVDS